MSTSINRVSRTISAVIVTGLPLVTGVGCATTDAETTKPKRVNPIVEQAKAHVHKPWRYRHRGHWHTRPMRKGQKPVFPCKQRDGGAVAATKEVENQ